MSIYYIDPSSQVQSSNIGEDTFIWQFVVILPGAKIGKNCNINCHCFIENDVIIGDNVTLKSGVFLWDGMRLENNVFIGPNVTFVNDMYPRSKNHAVVFEKTLISNGASIGANSTILGGLTIGMNAMIGAGSVVTRNVQNNSLWVGNPAQFKAFICDCGRKLNPDLTCSHCNNVYAFSDENRSVIYKKR